MIEALFHDVIQRVLLSFNEFADLETWVPAESRDVLSGDTRMPKRFSRLVAQPLHDRDAVVAEDHEGVVRVAHDASEFAFKLCPSSDSTLIESG